MMEHFSRRFSENEWTMAVLATIPVVGIGTVVWPVETIGDRIVRDAVLYGLVSLVLVVSFGRDPIEDLGLTVDRAAVRATVILTGCVLPFYVIGASLPSVRAAYPMWETTPTLSFLVHALGMVCITAAVELYYRGVLCLGLRHLGPVCILAHLPLYVFVHLSGPGIEIVLSGLAGLLFGAVAYKTRSILPTVVAHGSGIIVLDILVLLPPLWPELPEVLPLL